MHRYDPTTGIYERTVQIPMLLDCRGYVHNCTKDAPMFTRVLMNWIVMHQKLNNLSAKRQST